jgi:hypothetical protein
MGHSVWLDSAFRAFETPNLTHTEETRFKPSHSLFRCGEGES